MPSRNVFDAIVYSTLNASPAGPREKSSVQPTRSNASVPLGASTTPSTEMYSVMTSRPIGFLLSCFAVRTDGPRQTHRICNTEPDGSVSDEGRPRVRGTRRPHQACCRRATRLGQRHDQRAGAALRDV